MIFEVVTVEIGHCAVQEGGKSLFALDGDGVKTSQQLRDEVRGKTGEQMEEPLTLIQAKKTVNTRRKDVVGSRKSVDAVDGDATPTRKKKVVVIKRVVKKKDSSSSIDEASAAGDDKVTEVNGVERGHSLGERKKKRSDDGPSLFNQLIDDTEDDFSKMCQETALGKDANGLDGTDPMAFLVGQSEDTKSKLSGFIPDLSPPPLPKCAPPPLPDPKLTVNGDCPPPLPNSPLSTPIYMNGEGDVSSLVSQLRAELSQAQAEKMVVIRERDKLQEELDGFLDSTKMLNQAKEALHEMRSEREDSMKSEKALKVKLKDKKQETELLQRESKSLKKKLEDSEKKAKDLGADKDTLMFFRTSLQKKMAELREENEHLAAQLKKTENELANSLKDQQLQQQELEKTRDEVGNMVTTFEEKMQLVQVENDSLIDDIRATRATAKRHRKNCQNLELEKKQWESEKSKLESQVTALKKTATDAGQSSQLEIIALQQQVAEASALLKQQKDENTKQIEKLQSQVAELESDTATLKSEKSTAAKQAAQQKKTLSGKVSNLEKMVQEMEDKLQSVEKQNHELEEQLKSAQQETKVLKGNTLQLNKAKKDIEKLEKENETLQQKLETMSRQNAKPAISEWQKEKEKMTKEMEKYQERVKLLETDKKDMMEYMVELEDKVDKLEKSNVKTSDLKKEANEMRENWKGEQNRVTTLKTEINELKTEIKELKKAKDDLQRETKHNSNLHSEEVQAFHSTLKGLQQELEQARNEKETIRKTLESNYETKLANERRKSVSIENQMTALQSQHSALERELSEVKAESNQLRSRLSLQSKRQSESLSSNDDSILSISTVEEIDASLEAGENDNVKITVSSTPDMKSPKSGPPPVSKKPIVRQINSGIRETSSAPSSPLLSRIRLSSQKSDTTDTHKDINELKPNPDTQSPPTPQKTVITHTASLSNGKTSSHVVDSLKPPVISRVTRSYTPPSSPSSRFHWEQVKTVVVSAPTSKPSPTPSQNIDQITALPGSKVAAVTKKFGEAVGGMGAPRNKLMRSKSFTPGTRGQSREQSKKEMLLRWCQVKTQGHDNVNITNFARSWNNGMAFCALIHHYFPDKIPYDELKPENKAENFHLAFKVAEEEADIPQLLEVEDMVAMETPDWMSVMTYVSVIYSHLASRDRK
jgi:predicted  nucleic acid-binding Zn-ribbon protein